MKFLGAISSILLSVILYADPIEENTLKSVYLYHIAQLTDWKYKSSNTFQICYWNHDMGDSSKELTNRLISKMQIQNTVVSNMTNMTELEQCKIVYIPDDEYVNTKNSISQLTGKPVLIISESNKIENSHIILIKMKNKLAFDINLKYAKKSNLEFSSRLLKLARRITE